MREYSESKVTHCVCVCVVCVCVCVCGVCVCVCGVCVCVCVCVSGEMMVRMQHGFQERERE